MLSKTNTPVFVGEAGIPLGNGRSWYSNIGYYVQDMYRMPGQVRGYAIYILAQTEERIFAADVDPDGVVRSYAGSMRVGQR